MIGVRLQGNAIDLANWKPPRRETTDRHGELATEKLPTQRSRYMLSPAGHGVWVAMHSGSGNRSPNDAHALRTFDEKVRKGFLPFDICPQTLSVHDRIPQAVRGRAACQKGANGGPIKFDNPCACLKEIEALRTAKNEKEMLELERRYLSKEEREKQQRERQIDALEKQNAALAEGGKKKA